MSTARRRVKSPLSLYHTSTHPNMVTVMVMNDQFMSILFHVNWPSHSWDKTISNFDLENSKPRSWIWLKGKVGIQLICFPFYFTSISPTILEIQLHVYFKSNLEKSNVNVKGKVKSWGCIIDPVSYQYISFYFMPIRPTKLEIWPIVFDFEKTHPK